MPEFESDPLPFLPRHSDMARRIREFDWSQSPLGPPEQWPAPLKAAAGICLNSAFPTAIYWGPQLLLIYNDAWAPIPAERHPWALGRPGAEVWADIWDTVGPQMERVLQDGEGFSTFDQLLWMERQGRARETYWNYSFTPITGEEGEVGGIFNQGHEVTARVFEERRQQFVLRLSDTLRPLGDPKEIIRTAQRLLGEQLRADRVGYAEIDEAERYALVAEDWNKGLGSIAGRHDLAAFGEEIRDSLRKGVPLLIEDVRTDPRTQEPETRAAFEALGVRSAMSATLVKDGRALAGLFVHGIEPRSWSDGDVRVVLDVAERTWAELARARAEAQAGASEERYRRIFEQASDLIITADLQQVITDCNPSAAQAVGLTREEVIGRNIADFILPDDLERTQLMLHRKMEEGGTTRYDVQVRGARGETLFWEINSGLTHDEDGTPVGLHVVGRDITERRRWERHQRLLVAELNHRVKNTLAIVQGLAHQTFQADKPPREAISAYEGRLSALAAAHNLLTRENWEAASVADVARQALLAFCSEDRCSISGPDLRVAPQTAVSLALALHELATNASKYGSLSVAAGRVDLSWSVHNGELDLLWRESGGPPVAVPSSAGFGTRMIKRALASELKGEVELSFEPQGVTCRVRAPLEDMAIAA